MKTKVCKKCLRGTDKVSTKLIVGNNNIPDPDIRSKTVPFECIRCGNAIKDGEEMNILVDGK